MRILEIGPGILPIPPDGFGAIERVIWNLYLALHKRGHQVFIYNKLIIDPNQFPKDCIIHCHWASHAHDLARYGLPYAYTSHSHVWQDTCLKAIMDSKAYLCLHEGMVPDEYTGAVVPVGNGVNVELWRDLGLEREKRVVACANYSPRKRLEWMMDLIDLLPDPWSGLVVGPKVPSSLEQHPRVNLLDERTSEELAEIYNRSMVGFHPAEEEAFALVPMEMAACGLHTLVFEGSYVYPPHSGIRSFGDVETAANIILRFAPSYSSMSYSNTAKAHCSWELVAERVEKGLERMNV